PCPDPLTMATFQGTLTGCTANPNNLSRSESRLKSRTSKSAAMPLARTVSAPEVGRASQLGTLTEVIWGSNTVISSSVVPVASSHATWWSLAPATGWNDAPVRPAVTPVGGTSQVPAVRVVPATPWTRTALCAGRVEDGAWAIAVSR